VNPSDRLGRLLARRDEFKGFLASHLGGNHADAEDILQHSLVKAIAAAGTLREEQRLVPWFYQLLRHAMIDHIRSRHAAKEREHLWTGEAAAIAPDLTETTRHLCACIEPLIETLPTTQATLLRRVELGDESVQHVATELGLTANNASVTLHRARASLRAKLVSFCGDCASGACLECDCG
jgi:RNA polymerase sigma factor (sigma-70 family)